MTPRHGSLWRMLSATARRALAAACVAAAGLAVAAAGSAAAAQAQRFPDVPADHYAHEAIEWAAEAGVTTGYDDGTFKPQRPLNRRHAIVFMGRYYDEILGADQSEDFTRGDMMVLLKAINDGALRGDTPQRTAPGAVGAAQSQRFPDVPAGHYAFEAVEWAADAGVTTGYDDGTFKPQRPLNRRHAIVFMGRYYDEILGADQSEDFTRGDMMVLLKAINDGALRNLSGFRDAMKPIPADLAAQANVVTTGPMEMPVYICAPANTYRVAHLRTAVAELNREVGPFFAEQSSGEVDLRFTVGGIVSPPNIDWATFIFQTKGDVDLCEAAAIEQEGHWQLYVLVDVVRMNSGGLLGYAYTGLGPAVQPMKDDFENTYGSARGSARYFDTFAHEVGHSRFGFCHNHETYQDSRCPLSAYHNANVYDPHDDSLMSYSGTDNLDTTHIACAHRAQAGWPPGPPLPNGQACTGGGPGPQPTSVPDRPSSLSVTPGDGQLVVRWEPPAPPAGQSWQWLTGYTVSFDNGQGDSGRRNVSDTRVIIASLTNGVEYTIEVTATNEVGAGPAAVATATPGGDTTGVPGPPTGVAAVEGDRELTVSWSAPSDDGGAPVTGYTIRSGDGSINAAVGASTRTYRLGGLVNGRSYTISVYAQNRNGMSRSPATVTATPTATRQVPDAPVVTVEGPVEGNAIDVFWKANDNGSPIDLWEVSVPAIGFFDTLSPDDRWPYWHSWDPGDYTVYVRAHNAAGWSEWGSGTLTIWPAPDTPVVTAWSVDGTLEASWYANDNGSRISEWWVYALDQDGTEWSPSTVTAASATWTNLPPGDYTVYASASNEANWSEWGNSNSVTIESFIAVTAGDAHSCGLRTDATITCWGNNYYGQADAPSGTYSAVTAGKDYSCGLRTDATITCWGDNDFGQADAPSGTYSAVTARAWHSCGLRTDATITCWGNNYYGQADAPSGAYSAVTAGWAHSCGLRTDATITCWGWNEYGQADAPSGAYSAVTAGGDHSCGLRTDGVVVCWGDLTIP